MADNRKERGGRDRARVAAGQAYEVDYFRRKHKLSKDDAVRIIKEARGSRERANELAQQAQR